ncbi:hypothetical protein TrRE_jg9043 [Triparma retinervis]|uniref:Uncharacterized protein n=1 Tax=Triparma retinervis TaxID=2557542 RepID=A0A9W7E9L3_9STRA|nr:hypothetical protein TrRE_jg9043 [Triparma retinervis]
MSSFSPLLLSFGELPIITYNVTISYITPTPPTTSLPTSTTIPPQNLRLRLCTRSLLLEPITTKITKPSPSGFPSSLPVNALLCIPLKDVTSIVESPPPSNKLTVKCRAHRHLHPPGGGGMHPVREHQQEAYGITVEIR